VNREERRKRARQLNAAGVAAVTRIVIEGEAIVKAQEKGVDLIDLVMLHVDSALHDLVDKGGDIMRHSVVTIGSHPEYPGALTIEAKAAHLVAPGDPDPVEE
jgi:hypothetical protein